jgi:uncharacterized protein (UPF0303 family)
MTDAQTQALTAKLQAVQAELADLTFDSFNEDAAWRLGSLMRERAAADALPIAIDIRLGDAPLCSIMMPGANASNFDWARRKRNLSLLVGASSWELSLATALGTDIVALMGLDSRDYTPHGGCVPIRVTGVAGIVATVTVSGLPQEDDHVFAVEALKALKAGA